MKFILFALLIKGLYVAFQINEIRQPGEVGLLSVTTGDTELYLDPVENLINNGAYDPDYRMPGLAAPYFLLRQVLDIAGSRDALVILQWLLAGLCVHLLTLIALRLSGSVRIAWGVYILYLLSAYASWYDASISSDSLAVSCFIIHVHLLDRAITKGHGKKLMLAGFFLAWLIFLRPITVLLIIPSGAVAYWFWPHGRNFRYALLVAIPFLVLDGVWIVRNWHVNHAFNPLTNQGFQPTYFTKETRSHVMTFLQGYGGNYIWWAPGSDMRWFGIWKGGGAVDNEGRAAKEPPPYAYVPGYDRDSLYWISERIREVASGEMTPSDSLETTEVVQAKLDHYTELYKHGAPLNYHVLSRLRMVKNVMWQNGTESMIMRPFSELPLWVKLFKVFQVLMYVFAYSVGALATLLLPWMWRKELSPLRILVPVIVAYMTLIFPLGLRMCEWRYMVHQFPFALTLAVILNGLLIQRSAIGRILPIASRGGGK